MPVSADIFTERQDWRGSLALSAALHGLFFGSILFYGAVFGGLRGESWGGIGAGGRFYDKKIETFGSVQVPAETSGIPVPKEIKFMVTPTDPNQIAYLTLTDLTNAFSDLTSAVTGANIPKVPLPANFVQIKGTKVGEGPFIDLNLNIGLDAGLEMAGGLTV